MRLGVGRGGMGLAKRGEKVLEIEMVEEVRGARGLECRLSCQLELR